MKLLLTGGSGFIGKHCLALLSAQGHEVLALGRTQLSKNLPGVEFLKADLTDLSEEVIAKINSFSPDACLHLAWQGIPDYSFENCERNFLASVHLYRAALKAGCKKILGAGSCWEYGELRGKVSEVDFAKKLGIFAAFKIASRQILESLCAENGASAIWARIFFVYGPGQRNEALIPSTMKKIQNNEPVEIKNPNAKNDFVYVADVARAILGLIESEGSSGIYNLGSGQATAVGDLVQELFSLLGNKSTYRFSREDRPQDCFWADLTRLEGTIAWKPGTVLKTGLQLTSEHYPVLLSNTSKE